MACALYGLLQRQPDVLSIFVQPQTPADRLHEIKPNGDGRSIDRVGHSTQFSCYAGPHPRLLEHLAHGSLARMLRFLDMTFRKHPLVGIVRGFDEQILRLAIPLPKYDAAGVGGTTTRRCRLFK